MQPGRYKVLFYEYVADVAERRGPLRPGHLDLIRSLVADGTIAVAGALGDPPEGAAIVFADVDDAVIEDYVSRDPYVSGGLVTSWRITPWTVVTETPGS